MKTKNILLVFMVFALAACSAPKRQNVPAEVKPTESPEQAQGQQGSGVVVAADSSFEVVNPTSGADLHAEIHYPQNWDGTSELPALILVPGGSGNSSGFLRPSPFGTTVDVINNAGYIAVIFDPDGRGQSGGTENYNGFIHQDGLAEVVRIASTLPGVDPKKIGIVTNSYGITMGSGALARYPDLPVKFLIDWEGPANRLDTGGCDASGLGHLTEVATCDDEAFWAEREASTFISQIHVPYQRIQSEKDHVQPDYAHTVLMINNAVNGSSPWVRLNNETPNQTYDINAMPRMLPDSQDKQNDALIVEYAGELFEE